MGRRYPHEQNFQDYRSLWIVSHIKSSCLPEKSIDKLHCFKSHRGKTCNAERRYDGSAHQAMCATNCPLHSLS